MILDAVRLYRVYGRLDTLSLYLYYELLFLDMSDTSAQLINWTSTVEQDRHVLQIQSTLLLFLLLLSVSIT